MSEAIATSAIDANGLIQDASGASGKRASVQLEDRQEIEFGRTVSVQEVSNDALEYIVTRPSSQPPGTDQWKALADPTYGQIGELRNEISSNASSEMKKLGVGSSQESDLLQAETTRQITKLYLDLTHYQVAWKIAQKTQQDISQLLRGG